MLTAVAGKNCIATDHHIFKDRAGKTIGRYFRDLQTDTGKFPVRIGQKVTVAAGIKLNRGIEIIFQRLDIPIDRFGRTGNIEIFLNIQFPQQPGDGRTVGIAVFPQQTGQAYDSQHLFFTMGIKISF